MTLGQSDDPKPYVFSTFSCYQQDEIKTCDTVQHDLVDIVPPGSLTMKKIGNGDKY